MKLFPHKLRQRFATRSYDERRILFDLGQAARGAINIGDLYRLSVTKIADALGTKRISIFIRDEATGDFVARVSTHDENITGNEEASPEQFAPPVKHGVLEKNSLVVKRLRGLSMPLGVTARDLETWTRAFAASDTVARARCERVCATLREMEARLLVGITMQDRLVGILAVGEREDSRVFSAEDKRMLMSVASQLAFVIENAKLVERLVEEEGLRRELALAAEVQQKLLPARPLETSNFTLTGFCRPARVIGGDYYDFLSLGAGQTGIAVADVAGKGIAAALLMSSVQACLRSQLLNRRADIDEADSVIDLIRTMNKLVYASTGDASYVTFFYALFDEGTRRLHYINAGHNPPLLIKAQHPEQRLKTTGRGGTGRGMPGPVFLNGAFATKGSQLNGAAVLEEAVADRGFDDLSRVDHKESGAEIRELTVGGSVLGVFEDYPYEQETIQMESGDLLVAYTDGLTEALSVDGVEFGETQLRETLVECAHLSAEEVRDVVLRKAREWCAGTAQHDDLTFVILKVK